VKDGGRKPGTVFVAGHLCCRWKNWGNTEET